MPKHDTPPARKIVENAATSYTCPMHPKIQQYETGQCPTCGMNLTAVPNKAGGLMRRLFGRNDYSA